MKIINSYFRDPEGNPASAYIVRAWFADGGHEDGLYCANTKEYAFRQGRQQGFRPEGRGTIRNQRIRREPPCRKT